MHLCKNLNLPIYIYCCGKDEYILEDKDGKKVPKRLGIQGIIQNMVTDFNI